MSKYTESFTIRGCDIDSSYKIKPSALCGYFQESFARYCTCKNLAAFDVISDNILWVVSEIHIEFANLLPFWSERIETQIWISEVKELRMYLDFTISSNGMVIAKGDSCWFMIDSQTRRPRPVDKVCEKFEHDNKCVFGEHKRLIITPQGKPVDERLYKVGLSDLDFNYHVNNLAYINTALEAIDAEYRKENSLNSYMVTYLKESFLHDEWIQKIYKQDNSFIHSFERKQDGKIVCMLQTNWQKAIKDTRDIRFANFDIKNQDRKVLLKAK